MNARIMEETSTRSFEGSITFPEVVQKLAAIGLESYDVDLVQKLKVFYMPDGKTHSHPIPVPAESISAEFSAEEVISAIRLVQAGKLSYVDFLAKIMGAGTTHYRVYISGRKAIYFGRKGEFHIENFPSAK